LKVRGLGVWTKKEGGTVDHRKRDKGLPAKKERKEGKVPEKKMEKQKKPLNELKGGGILPLPPLT